MWDEITYLFLNFYAPRSHYSDIIMGAMTSKITSLTIVCSPVYAGADQRKHQSSASLAFVRGIHRWQVNSPHKWPVTRKMFRSDDVIMMKQGLRFGVIRIYYGLLEPLYWHLGSGHGQLIMPHDFLWDAINYLCPHFRLIKPTPLGLERRCEN